MMEVLEFINNSELTYDQACLGISTGADLQPVDL